MPATSGWAVTHQGGLTPGQGEWCTRWHSGIPAFRPDLRRPWKSARRQCGPAGLRACGPRCPQVAWPAGVAQEPPESCVEDGMLVERCPGSCGHRWRLWPGAAHRCARAGPPWESFSRARPFSSARLAPQARAPLPGHPSAASGHPGIRCDHPAVERPTKWRLGSDFLQHLPTSTQRASKTALTCTLRSGNSTDVAEWPRRNTPCSVYRTPANRSTVTVSSMGFTIQYSGMRPIA